MKSFLIQSHTMALAPLLTSTCLKVFLKIESIDFSIDTDLLTFHLCNP